MAIEIVVVPIKNGDFPWQNVSLPEGNPHELSHDGSIGSKFGAARKMVLHGSHQQKPQSC